MVPAPTPPPPATQVFRPGALHGGMAASRRLPYIYVQNSKCASSTIRNTLWAAEHALGLTGPPGRPHNEAVSAPLVHDPRRWEQVEREFVFTVARNPSPASSRPISIRSWPIATPGSGAGFAARHGLSEAPLAFRDFLQLIAETPEDEMDQHWRPQSCGLAPTIVPYDFIGGVENLQADLAHILRRIFPDRTVPIRDHKPHRTDSAEKLAQYYGPEELRLARAIYERDFGELGYDLDIASPSRRTPTPRPDSRIIKAWGRACRLMSERDFAAAEREFMDLRPWISGVAVDEQLLHCRCELKGSDRAAIKENVASLEEALARGQEEWSDGSGMAMAWSGSAAGRTACRPCCRPRNGNLAATIASSAHAGSSGAWRCCGRAKGGCRKPWRRSRIPRCEPMALPGRRRWTGSGA